MRRSGVRSSSSPPLSQSTYGRYAARDIGDRQLFFATILLRERACSMVHSRTIYSRPGPRLRLRALVKDEGAPVLAIVHAARLAVLRTIRSCTAGQESAEGRTWCRRKGQRFRTRPCSSAAISQTLRGAKTWFVDWCHTQRAHEIEAHRRRTRPTREQVEASPLG